MLFRSPHDVDPKLLDLFASVHDDSSGSPEMQDVSVRGLRVGMIIGEDLLLKTGVLLAPRGYEVTAGMVERLRNFAPGALKEPVRIILPRSAV